MKRIALFIILYVLLTSSMSIYNTIGQYSNDRSPNPAISVIQDNQLNGELSRPILISVKNATDNTDLTVLRNRNDTIGNGAIHRGLVNQNVTFRYLVVNGDENTTIRFYADIPNNNLTLSVNDNLNHSYAFTYDKTEYKNYTLPYGNEKSSIFNATLSYYDVEVNVTADFFRYYAAIDTSTRENIGNAPFNFLTTKQYWTSESQDDFYIQFEHVNITISAFDVSVNDTYGISYKKNTSSAWIDLNFTDAITSVNYTSALDLGDFDIGISIQWKSYAILKDETSNETRKVDSIDYNTVDIGDGTPNLNVTLESSNPNDIFKNNILYTQQSNVTLKFSATVAKGNISRFTISENKTNTPVVIAAVGNVSLFGEQINKTVDFISNGVFNLTTDVITNKNIEFNKTFIIVVDSVTPTASFSTDSLTQKITEDSGLVTFSFSFSDDNSGVRSAIIDFGDGTSMDVTHVQNITHIYTQKSGSYIVKITVIDWSGNEFTTTANLQLVTENLANQKAIVAPELLFTMIVIALLILSPYWGPKIKEKFQ